MTLDKTSAGAAAYSHFKGWHQELFGQYKRHWAAYYRKELLLCQKLSKGKAQPSLRLLEIGFGNGSFMGWARDQGHLVYGIDIDAAQLGAASAAGFMVAGSLDALQDKWDLSNLDGVVAFDVFEHLAYPQLSALLTKLRTVLKPHGWVLARFPNGDSPFGRLNQHGDLTHVSTLGSVAVAQLAHSAGIRLAKVQSPSTPFRGAGFAHMTANVVALGVRTITELPVQALLNSYYVGTFRWYPLHPNLIAIFLND